MPWPLIKSSSEGAEAAIGGGVETISLIVRDNDPSPAVKQEYPGIYMVMGETAEVVAKRYQISRQAQDEYALISQQRTARAQQEGFFAGEIVPMKATKAVLDKKTGGSSAPKKSVVTTTSATAPTLHWKDCSRSSRTSIPTAVKGR